MSTYPDPTFSSIPNREVWSESPFGAPGAEVAKRLAEEAEPRELGDGGPAFHHPSPDPHYYGSVVGMSLRDWFAGQALGGLILVCGSDTLAPGETYPQHLVENAYQMADAMLAERNKD